MKHSILNTPYRLYIYKLKNNILKTQRINGDALLREELEQSPYVTLTIDGWSTRRLLCMMGVIVYYYREMATKASVLSIELFRGPHTGQRIAEFTINTCKYWGIINKIVRIGTDNGANMVKAFAHFDDYIEFEVTELPDIWMTEKLSRNLMIRKV